MPTPPTIRTVRLDPYGKDHHGEAERLRAAGPVVRVILPGEVEAWAVTTHDLVDKLVRDDRVSKGWRNWSAVKDGTITSSWPLIGMLAVDNMVTADGVEHRRLRRLVSKTMTRGAVEARRSRIEEVVDELLDELADHADGRGVVDLRSHYAVVVPLQVICELIGVPRDWWPELRRLVDSIFRTDTTPEEAVATEQRRVELLRELVELRRRDPQDDITTALLRAREDDPGALSDVELIDTLWLLATAGHETTASLIGNAIRALLTHPAQKAVAVVRGDDDVWAAVVEETLRWDAPIGNFMGRYPIQDVAIAGVTIRKGEMILAPYSAVGCDPQQHGATADVFDITRNQRDHLAFGGGPHICLGMHLARLEARIALQRLFARFPEISLAVPARELPPVPSLFTNSSASLPVRLQQ